MMRSEKSVTLELENFEKKMESWFKVHHAIPAASTSRKTGDEKDNASRPPEVIAFDVSLFCILIKLKLEPLILKTYNLVFS